MKSYELTAYPKPMALSDGREVVIRTLAAADADALLRFFLGLPEPERYFLKDDVTSPGLIASWAEHHDYARVLPLVAVSGDAIVADAVLIRRRHGAYRDVASVRVAVAPAFRERGLGTALLRELCDIAADAELERVTAEFVAGVQDDAIAAAEHLGFIRAATVHELLRDEHRRPHDLVILMLPLGKWYQWARF